ncbi:unnamed protein product [Onchocerca flexuosa]|uniref:Uncharacterized protein n=1 Tax=Onchocerca flexuosa TaxID=387005 RepID=A0A183HMK2_9BILA|nr:unnamed protein product [Onchocerca flexuosa]
MIINHEVPSLNLKLMLVVLLEHQLIYILMLLAVFRCHNSVDISVMQMVEKAIR